MNMQNQLPKILQSLLRISGKGPEQLEEIEAAAQTRYQLYQQEQDKVGMELYLQMLEAIKQAKSVEDLKNNPKLQV